MENMATFIFVIGLFVAGTLADSNGDFYYDISALHKQLLAGYDKNVLPKETLDQGVKVSLDFTLIQLDDVEEDEGEVGVTVWLSQSWHDSRLRWDSNLHHGLEKVAFPQDAIWIPDVTLYNGVHAPEKLNDNAIIVKQDGTVIFVPALRLRASCPISENSVNVTCIFKLGSWVHDTSYVDVEPGKKHMEVSDLYTNPKWGVHYVQGERKAEKYDCCPSTYSSVEFSVQFLRKE
ncbi:neuronal acetylcholine receptor subunit alpha-10-like [Liolophura sinensis]|uniref:neuronal acetylcholine receptor subunit alpha-10-like n=1 Tax=Liolophura sinensis TaxID=3198878 RepID=UPI0031593431